MAGRNCDTKDLKVVASVHEFNQKAETELNELKKMLDSLNFLLFGKDESDGSDDNGSDSKNDVQGSL